MSQKVSQAFDSYEARSNYKLNNLHFNLAWLYKAEINIKIIGPQSCYAIRVLCGPKIQFKNCSSIFI